MFSKVANIITKIVGTSAAFISAVLLIIIWAITGFYFHWSEMHSLFINTVTTIITFLLVFLIQYTQNKDTRAIHLKLDEVIKALDKANNKMAGIEELTDEQLLELKQKT